MPALQLAYPKLHPMFQPQAGAHVPLCSCGDCYAQQPALQLAYQRLHSLVQSLASVQAPS